MLALGTLCLAVRTSDDATRKAEGLIAVANRLLEEAKHASEGAVVNIAIDEPQCRATVHDRGCFSETFPRVYERAYKRPGTAWGTMSPVECACLCTIRHAEQWDGHVGLGGASNDAGECGCKLKRTALNDGNEPAALNYDYRAPLPAGCCFDFSPETQLCTLGANNRCPDVERTVEHDPGMVERGWAYTWAVRVFQVELCPGECSPLRCPRRYTTQPSGEALEWGDYAICPSGAGSRYHCNAPPAPEADAAAAAAAVSATTTTTRPIRIGSRNAAGGNDVVFEVPAPRVRAYSAEWAHTWGAQYGVVCDTALILAHTANATAMRGLDYALPTGPPLPAGTSAEDAARLVKASLKVRYVDSTPSINVATTHTPIVNDCHSLQYT